MKAVILISGKMRSGKNQFATFFEHTSSFITKEFSFANALKNICYRSFSKLNALKGYTFENYDTKKDDITRAILTAVGTDLIQNELGMKNFWTNKMIEKLNEYKDPMNSSIALITDARYEHEISTICNWAMANDIPVYSVRINRKQEQSEHNKILESHTSETALDTYPCFSYTLDNDGTLDEFKDSVGCIYNDILEDIANAI